MRKIFAVLLCLVFALSVLVGCGSNKKERSGNAPFIETQVAGSAKQTTVTANSGKITIAKNGTYTDKEHVAKYIYEYKTLPSNYITKNQAKKLGWQTKGTLDKVAPGKSIGGDRYGDYENKLPKANGRKWTECDIDYVKGNRNAKRIIFSSDGLIYYTNDHYQTFNRVDVK